MFFVSFVLEREEKDMRSGLTHRSRTSFRASHHHPLSSSTSVSVSVKKVGGGDVVVARAKRRNNTSQVAYIPDSRRKEEEEIIARTANALELFLKENEVVANGGKTNGSSSSSSSSAIEKAREVADLAKEAARLASVAASLENSIVLPSAAETRVTELEHDEARRRNNNNNKKREAGASSSSSHHHHHHHAAAAEVDVDVEGSSSSPSSVTGKIRPISESKEFLSNTRRRQRVRRARSARRQRRASSSKASGDCTSVLNEEADHTGSSNLTIDEISAAGGDFSLHFDLLTAKEEQQLAVKVKELSALEDCYFKVHSKTGKVPTMREWAAAAGLETAEELEERYGVCLQAKQRMIGANIRLVQSVAKKYVGSGLEFSDLVQEGCLGLVRGAEKFDPSKGYKFSTYAHWWVRQSITRAIQDNGRDVRLPVHLHELMTKVRAVQSQLREDPNFLEKAEAKGKGSGEKKTKAEEAEPSSISSSSTYAKIARHLNVEEDRVNKLAKLMEDPVSFEQKVDGSDGRDSDASGMTFDEVIGDEGQDSPELFAYNERLCNDVKNMLNTLSERERKIITLRYGVLRNRQMTLEQIGSEFSVTRERIRQIESRALRKLRQPERNSIVVDYTESWELL